jgi:hypothetical protein
MMNKILKPAVQSVGLVALMFVADAQAIIGVAPGGSVVRRHAIVATTTVAATSANANAAATANANAAAANANAAAAAAKPAPAPAAGTPPAVGTTVTTLPPGCKEDNLNGVAYQRCGSTYYKPTMMGSNLVFVVAQP